NTPTKSCARFSALLTIRWRRSTIPARSIRREKSPPNKQHFRALHGAAGFRRPFCLACPGTDRGPQEALCCIATDNMLLCKQIRCRGHLACLVFPLETTQPSAVPQQGDKNVQDC